MSRQTAYLMLLTVMLALIPENVCEGRGRSAAGWGLLAMFAGALAGGALEHVWYYRDSNPDKGPPEYAAMVFVGACLAIAAWQFFNYCWAICSRMTAWTTPKIFTCALSIKIGFR